MIRQTKLTRYYQTHSKHSEAQVLAMEESTVLTQNQTFRQLMQKHYGSTIRPHRLTYLNNKYIQLKHLPTRFQTEPHELQLLLEVISWHTSSLRKLTALDPFVGEGTIPDYFEKKKIQLLWGTNDIDPNVEATSHLDACSPDIWRNFPLVDCIISSPPWELLDGLIPMMEAQAQLSSAIHVQGDYITSAPKCRQQWLSKLVQQQRLCTIQGLARPKTRELRGSLWILIFKDEQARSIIWHPESSIPTYLPAAANGHPGPEKSPSPPNADNEH